MGQATTEAGGAIILDVYSQVSLIFVVFVVLLNRLGGGAMLVVLCFDVSKFVAFRNILLLIELV